AAEERGRARWDSGRAHLGQAEQWANEAEDDVLKQKVRQARADFELAHDLNQVREEEATLLIGKWRPMRERDPEVFQRHGLDVLGRSRTPWRGGSAPRRCGRRSWPPSMAGRLRSWGGRGNAGCWRWPGAPTRRTPGAESC